MKQVIQMKISPFEKFYTELPTSEVTENCIECIKNEVDLADNNIEFYVTKS